MSWSDKRFIGRDRTCPGDGTGVGDEVGLLPGCEVGLLLARVPGQKDWRVYDKVILCC